MIHEKFKNIFVINLKRRQDRLQATLNELSKIGVPEDYIQVWKAIDGSEIENNTPILKGELGILRTLKELFIFAKTLNLKDILIIEDDCVFSASFKSFYNRFTDQLPEDWDMIYFGGCNMYGERTHKILDNILKLNYTTAMHCVAVKNTMFDKIIEALSKEDKQSDKTIAEMHSTHNVYGFIPWLAFQRPGFSDIQQRDTNYGYLLNEPNL